MRGRGCAAVAMLATLWCGPAQAWETRVDAKGPSQWRSLYQLDAANPAAAALLQPLALKDEHTRLSDLALERLGLVDLFGRGGRANIEVTDLNASYFRLELLDGLPTVGDAADTVLEERRIPPPAHFSGIPDYSFTIYDWLNKNQLCPPGPQGEIGATCHKYVFGWLGNLNSTHFGSQASGMYRHYHMVALSYAARARMFHEAAREAGAKEAEAYRDEIREAELEALAYEGYAQHFLQDRWALGHMWERWNGPDYASVATPDNYANTAVSGVAGLIHGSEAVLAEVRNMPVPSGYVQDFISYFDIDVSAYEGTFTIGDFALKADPMSSPIMRNGRLWPLRWRHMSTPALTHLPGIGDDRLFDVQRGRFGAGYAYANPLTGEATVLEDLPLHVDVQFEQMIECSAAGWAEVVRALGQFDGSYGAWQAKLAPDAPAFEVLSRDTCWDMWATNEAMYLGFANTTIMSPKVMARLAWAANALADIIDAATPVSLPRDFYSGEGLPRLPRKEIVQLLARLELAYQDDPWGTDMARGAIGAFGPFQTGNAYGLPDFAHPAAMENLPRENERGLDTNTLFGAFSRAHSDHWCDDLPNLLDTLRARGDARKDEMCRFLADFGYGGTFEDYDGVQRERRKLDGAEIKSLCHVRALGGVEPRGAPYRLDQGYISYPAGPDALTGDGQTLQSIANWCNAVPVLTLSNVPEQNAENLVAEIDADLPALTLTGEDLGDLPGDLEFLSPDGNALVGRVTAWSATEIELDLAATDLAPGTDYRIALARGDDETESVGLFVLRIKEQPVELMRLDRVGPCRIPLDIEEYPVLDFVNRFGSWRNLTADRLERYSPVAFEFFSRAADVMEREAACIDALRAQNIAPQYDPDTQTLRRITLAPYAPIVFVEPDGRVHEVGTELGYSEIGNFTSAWGSADQDLYVFHADLLRNMAARFRLEIERLETEIDKARQREAESGRDPSDADLADMAKVWEDLLRIHTAAPPYMAYLATGLNRWAVVEQKLIARIMPRLEAMRVARFRALRANPNPQCAYYLSLPAHIAAVDLAVSTPQFTQFDRDGEDFDVADAAKNLHPYGGLIWRYRDRPERSWATPQRLEDLLGWRIYPLLPELIAGAESPDSPMCPSNGDAYRASLEMGSFDYLFGDQKEALMGMGALYEARFGAREGTYLPPDEVEFTCLRCALIDRAMADISQRMDMRAANAGSGFVPWGTAEGVYSSMAFPVPAMQARLGDLAQQADQCRRECVPVAGAEDAIAAGPPGGSIDDAIDAARDAGAAAELIDTLEAIRDGTFADTLPEIALPEVVIPEFELPEVVLEPIPFEPIPIEPQD